MPDAAADLGDRLRSRLSGTELDLTKLCDDEVEALRWPDVLRALDARANGIAEVTIDGAWTTGDEPLVPCLRQLPHLRTLCISGPLTSEPCRAVEIDLTGLGPNLQRLRFLGPHPPSGTRINIPATVVAEAEEAPSDLSLPPAWVIPSNGDELAGVALPLGVREQAMPRRPVHLAPLLLPEGDQDGDGDAITMVAEDGGPATATDLPAPVGPSQFQAAPRRGNFHFSVNLGRHFSKATLHQLQASIKGDALDLSGWTPAAAKALWQIRPQAWNAFLNDAKAAHLKCVVVDKALAAQPPLIPQLQQIGGNHFFEGQLPETIGRRLARSIKGQELDLTDWSEKEVRALWAVPEEDRAVLLRDPRAADLQWVAVNEFAASRGPLITGLKQLAAVD
jgi:hypothetical protein